ncbi:hypothetical protein CG477_006350 [Bacillus cytotoxicus]|nr:hypothetical protein CG481_006305 [Bacillus cytotoxicus]AWC44094.1 hypothetical protein CG479_005965 [Bacillus cytotoxicus]AWC52095.1 hypothetical protein CG477_006350 [Bacillus cytotoxicus]
MFFRYYLIFLRHFLFNLDKKANHNDDVISSYLQVSAPIVVGTYILFKKDDLFYEIERNFIYA